MRYEDAIKIGSSVEGYVRCTYVRLADVLNGYLYSLQHHDAYKVTDAHIEASEYFDGQYENTTNPTAPQDVINTADYSAFVEDIPVVKAVGRFAAWGSKQPMIECKLTQYAKDMIYRKIKSDYRTQPKYLVEKVWIKDVTESNVKKSESGSVESGEKILHKAGERQIMIETYKRNLAYSKEFLKYGIDKSKEDAFIAWYKSPTGKGQTVAPVSPELAIRIRDNKNGYMYVITEYPAQTEAKEQNLAEVLNKDATFIVKECAIDWFPTKIDGAFITDKDGKLVTIDVALANAKKRLDRAKAILAATATFAII